MRNAILRIETNMIFKPNEALGYKLFFNYDGITIPLYSQIVQFVLFFLSSFHTPKIV